MPRRTRKIKRARSPEARERRRRAILDAAEAMVAEEPFGDVHMTAVARAASLAKGTLYLYFSTKEELFLAVLERRLGEWSEAVAREVEATRGDDRLAALAAAITRSLAERELLTRLLSLLHTVLAPNVGFETALGFQRRLRATTTLLGVELERALPGLPAGEGSRVLLRIQAAVIGLRQMAEPPPALLEVLEADELEPFRIDFETELRRTVEALLREAVRP